MAILKCKMCGGLLNIQEGQFVATCEYCGVKQTLPRLDNEHKANLYDRANHFRRDNEFDKAMAIYEQILAEDNTDAESYWSLVLCKYGVEYVEDPGSRKRIPTVNRAQFKPVLLDENYQMALKYADVSQRMLYEEEAKAIDEIQKEILQISSKEEPFDVFICYKESDARGGRTIDSVLAQDIYYQLTEQGLKVFFSRITLESKVGQQYEPYIFAALNSAKVMVIVGTKPECFNAVWVKNEWSRFIKIAQSEKNRLLIPAYKDMDPYDLPKELSYYQAQDMSKIGFMQDLVRGIRKVIDGVAESKVRHAEGVVYDSGSNLASLLKRGYIALEDAEWTLANGFFERVLDIEAECADAYMGKLFVEYRVSTMDELCQSILSKTTIIQAQENKMHITSERIEYYKRLVEENGLNSDLLTSLYKPFVYETQVEARIKQFEEIKTDKHIAKVLRFSAKDSNVQKQMDILWEALQQRIVVARIAHELEKKKAQEEMEEVVAQVENEIREQIENREQKYQLAIANYTNQQSKYNKYQVYQMLKSLNGYKDSEEICNDIVEEYCKKRSVFAQREYEIENAGYMTRWILKKNEFQQKIKTLDEEKARFVEEYGDFKEWKRSGLDVIYNQRKEAARKALVKAQDALDEAYWFGNNLPKL